MGNVNRTVKTIKTENGKIAKVKQNGHKIYYTEEELAREKELYGEKLTLPDIDLKYLINVEIDLKDKISSGFHRAFKYIEPHYTALWIEKQTMVSRTNIQRLLRGQYVPSVQNFFRLLYFIEKRIDNFNIWSLIDIDAPIVRTKDYKPFKKFEGIKFEYEFERNSKKAHDVLDLPRYD